MRKFILSSSKFSGHIELIYKPSEHDFVLDSINFQHAQLTIQQRNYFKTSCPVLLRLLRQFVEELHFTCVEQEILITFDAFWDSYKKKINRKRCEPLWAKLSAAERLAALNGIQAYERYLQRESWRTKADPEKYLRDRYWENEWK